MGHHHHRHLLIGQLFYNCQDLPRQFGVEGTRRFVEAEHLGVEGQSAGNRDPLLLSSRELIGIGARFIGKAQLLQEGEG